jgi:hypothetical protein
LDANRSLRHCRTQEGRQADPQRGDCNTVHSFSLWNYPKSYLK